MSNSKIFARPKTDCVCHGCKQCGAWNDIQVSRPRLRLSIPFLGNVGYFSNFGRFNSIADEFRGERCMLKTVLLSLALATVAGAGLIWARRGPAPHVPETAHKP